MSEIMNKVGEIQANSFKLGALMEQLRILELIKAGEWSGDSLREDILNLIVMITDGLATDE